MHVRNVRTYLRRSISSSRHNLTFRNAHTRVQHSDRFELVKRARSMLGWTIQRRAVLERCGGCCERCGLRLRNIWECHHRKLRSQGGDDSICNLIALHMECHNASESGSVHHSPAAAYAAGYLVRSRQDPRDAPLLLYGKRWVLLEPTGTYTPTEGP